MLSRALIVLLLVLNLGVASWWALRPAPAPAALAAQPAGIARLQLLDEVPAAARPRASAASPAASVARVAIADADARCYAFGPFADAAALDAARVRLQPQVLRLHVRQAPAATRGWRVWLPSLADRAAAQAMVARITTAGFQDYYVVPGGNEANSIALGRFGNEDAARRRQKALQDAGFPAQAEALPAGTDTVQWLDVAAPAAFDADAVRAAVGAKQARTAACGGAR
jgi:cell division septation protein DedD